MIHLIAIQNRNDARYLPAAIGSIIHQPHVLLVGIDAGSEDNSIDVLERYSLEIADVGDVNQAAACNCVIRDFWDEDWHTFTWFNADDWLAENFVSVHRKAFAENPEPDIVCSDAWLFYQDEPEKGVGRWTASKVDLGERFSNNLNYVCQPTAMICRRVFETCGLFDEEIQYPFDYEFWRRAYNWGMQFRVIPHPTAWRRQTGAGEGRKQRVDERLGFTDQKTAEIRREMNLIHERYKDGAKRKVNPL